MSIPHFSIIFSFNPSTIPHLPIHTLLSSSLVVLLPQWHLVFKAHLQHHYAPFQQKLKFKSVLISQSRGSPVSKAHIIFGQFLPFLYIILVEITQNQLESHHLRLFLIMKFLKVSVTQISPERFNYVIYHVYSILL